MADQTLNSTSMWRVLYWVLFGAFLVAAVLNMTKTPAGFLTNHLADLVGPAWLYIVFRGLAEPEKRNRLRRFLGATSGRAATILLRGSCATEITQIYWPSEKLQASARNAESRSQVGVV